MTGEIVNHLWQSTVFAAAAGLLTLAFRTNRAYVRYALWLSASLKFLVPFALLIGLGSHLDRTQATKKTVAPAIASTMIEISEPFPEILPSAPTNRQWTPIILAFAWASGFATIAILRIRALLRIRAMVRGSHLVSVPTLIQARCAPGLMEPGVYGWLRPILLLPDDIGDRLTPLQLEAVFAHELCHVRRRDNLTSAMHMIVEALFWFHPLVWWIGARLVEERERACDEEVLRLGNEPGVYAEAILKVCSSYLESRLPCVAGVSGADLKQRLHDILTAPISVRLNFTKAAALACAAVVAIALPLFVGGLRAQSPQPKFEVASIKPCGSGDSGAKGGARGGGGPGQQGPSPDRLNLVCQPVINLIRMAYINFADGHRVSPMHVAPLEGGPSWIESARYKVDAKAEGTPGQEVMRGPMLQALLEDRLKVKVHRESREVPAYALTVAKGGPKLQASSEGSCFVLDFSHPPMPPPDRPFCGLRGVKTGAAGLMWQLPGGTLDDLASALGADLDRIVINKTGITGKYDFHLEFAADETTAGLNRFELRDQALFNATKDSDAAPSIPTGGLSIFTAIQQQLGLKLESSKGPREFVVIDHVEKPSEN